MNKIVKNVLWIGLAVVVLATAVLAVTGMMEDREDPQDRIAATGNHAMVIKAERSKRRGVPSVSPGFLKFQMQNKLTQADLL